MKRLAIILTTVLLLAGCDILGSDSRSTDCHQEELLRIIQYDGEITYQFESMYLHPERPYDVQEGNEYIYCIDDDRNIESIEPAD